MTATYDTATYHTALDPLIGLTGGALNGGPFADSGAGFNQSAAACADLGVDMFFSEHFDDIAAAKSLCLQCPVRDRCLDAAVARGEQYGVWGGQLFEAGRIVISKRRRGRPAKIARPGDTLPEVAVPPAYRRLVMSA